MEGFSHGTMVLTQILAQLYLKQGQCFKPFFSIRYLLARTICTTLVLSGRDLLAASLRGQIPSGYAKTSQLPLLENALPRASHAGFDRTSAATIRR